MVLTYIHIYTFTHVVFHLFFLQERIPEKPHGWFSMKGKGFEHRGLSFNMVSSGFLVLGSLVNSLFRPSHFRELVDITT